MQEHVDDVGLYACAQIRQMLVNKIRVAPDFLVQEIADRGFESRKTEIQTGHLRLFEAEAFGIAFAGKAVDLGTTRIGQSEHFGAFVEGLSSGIVQGLAKHFHVPGAGDPNELGMPAADGQAEEGEGGKGRLDEMGQDVGLHVVHPNQGNAPAKGQALGEAHAHQQAAKQSGALGDRNGIDGGFALQGAFAGHAGIFQDRVDERKDMALMGSGGQFRHHAPVALVDLLACLTLRNDALAIPEGGGCIVAGAFDAQNAGAFCRHGHGGLGLDGGMARGPGTQKRCAVGPKNNPRQG